MTERCTERQTEAELRFGHFISKAVFQPLQTKALRGFFKQSLSHVQASGQKKIRHLNKNFHNLFPIPKADQKTMDVAEFLYGIPYSLLNHSIPVLPALG